jgi:hypothetical protein
VFSLWFLESVECVLILVFGWICVFIFLAGIASKLVSLGWIFLAELHEFLRLRR